jgi:trimethylamine--corrinoid protein Co-methyltransferase
MSPEHIEKVHEGSLQILSRVGVRVDSRRALDVFARKGGPSIRIDGSRVFFESDVVDWAIQASPPTIDVYDRRGGHAFTLGDGQTRFGAGVTNLYYQDPMTEQVVPFARQHMTLGVKLGNVLPNFDAVSTLGILRDLDPKVADLYAVLEMVVNTTKPLILLISDEFLFPSVLRLLQALHGDVSAKPFTIPYLNPVTPLVLNEGTAEKLLDSVEHGLPFIYSNYGMAGASTPITCAGALTILNAELLMGLVLSQLAKEGAPIILGSLPAFFDMHTMVDFLDPQSYLMNLCCAEMMAHYHIPHAGTSGSGEGWGLDPLSAGNIWMNHLPALMGKEGLSPFVGSTLNSKAYSPSSTVLADDVIGRARLFAHGFTLDDQTIGLDEVIEVMAVDGHFLTSQTTINRYLTAYYGRMFPHYSLEKWEELGYPDANQLVREYTRDLLADARPPDDHDDLLVRGEAFIKSLSS